jgi:hypothetical protein
LTALLGVAAKSDYRTDRRPSQEIFNDQQKRIVEKAFAKYSDFDQNAARKSHPMRHKGAA